VTGAPGAIAAIAGGYLLGAIPVGLLVGRLAGNVDLRDLGSRRTGATNATRTLGWRWGALVLLLDVAKGVGAVVLARFVFRDAAAVEWVAAAAGLAAVVGHNWSAFIGFRGGRGVATTGGGLLALAPLAVLAVVPAMLLIVWRTRYVSAASLAGAGGAMLATAALAAAGLGSWAAFGYAVGAGGLVIASHGDNIARLRAGTERRIGEREAVSGDG
jgi:acyl phosphate:glycerol-3-phosphate acyltransferase